MAVAHLVDEAIRAVEVQGGRVGQVVSRAGQGPVKGAVDDGVGARVAIDIVAGQGDGRRGVLLVFTVSGSVVGASLTELTVMLIVAEARPPWPSLTW